MKLDHSEPKIIQWKNSLLDAGCNIESITPLSIQNRKNGDLLFAYLDADVIAPEGYRLLPIIFIRGDAVIIVPQITNIDTGDLKLLMVEQRRIASGRLHLEFPAGMVDRDVNHPARVAVKELSEETGLIIEESMLTKLFDKPLFSSPGASDEKIWYYGLSIKLSNDDFLSLDNRVRGEADENEHITTKLVTPTEFLDKNESTQALLAYELSKRKM